MDQLKAQVKHQEGVSVIQLAGYLSVEGAEVLEKALLQVAGADKILLAFREETYLNSAGLVMLFDLIMPWLSRGKQFRIVHPSKHFRRVLQIMGLNRYAEIFEAEEQALAGW